VTGPGHTECALVFAGGREIRISSLELPKFYSSRAYLPQQAAGRIRAEGWILGKFEGDGKK
jgi:hypothetical protein